MANEAVFPAPSVALPPRTGKTLPFIEVGTLRTGGDIDVSPVWPAPGGMTDQGYAYDHELEAPLSALAVLTHTNQSLWVEGMSFRVIDVQRNRFLPHLVVRMRRVTPGA